MKKPLLFLTILAVFSQIAAQERYRTHSGVISFNASTPLEDIEATNTRVNAIVEGTSGALAVVLLIKDFQFPRKLMQEHFNENFMESGRFPKAYFRGDLAGFRADSLAASDTPYTIEGQLTIHGVSRNVKANASVRKEGTVINLTSQFILAPEAYDIEVPKILFKKIAEEVEVTLQLRLRQDPTGSP